MRGITGIAIAFAIAACSRSHGAGDRDASADAIVSEDAPADAVSPSDAPPGAPMAPGCDRPISEWRRESFELPGQWSQVRLARDGESRFLVASPSDGTEIRAFALDPSSASPLPIAEVVLEATEDAGVAAADADRFRIATVAEGVLFVHDTSGALRSREVVSRPDGDPRIALIDVRVGVVIGLGSSGTIAEVRDVAGGPAISSTPLDGWTSPAIAEGRGLFAVLASDGSSSHYFGLDELGLVRAASLAMRFDVPSSDGTTFVGAGERAILVRHAGGRIDERPLPPLSPFSPPTIADGPHGALVATAGADGVWISVGAEWIGVDERDLTMGVALADQSAARLGAFHYPVGDRRIGWAGLTCRP